MATEPIIQKLAESAIMDAPQAADHAVEVVAIGKDTPAPKDGDDAKA